MGKFIEVTGRLFCCFGLKYFLQHLESDLIPIITAGIDLVSLKSFFSRRIIVKSARLLQWHFFLQSYFYQS